MCTLFMFTICQYSITLHFMYLLHVYISDITQCSHAIIYSHAIPFHAQLIPIHVFTLIEYMLYDVVSANKRIVSSVALPTHLAVGCLVTELEFSSSVQNQLIAMIMSCEVIRGVSFYDVIMYFLCEILDIIYG